MTCYVWLYTKIKCYIDSNTRNCLWQYIMVWRVRLAMAIIYIIAYSYVANLYKRASVSLCQLLCCQCKCNITPGKYDYLTYIGFINDNPAKWKILNVWWVAQHYVHFWYVALYRAEQISTKACPHSETIIQALYLAFIDTIIVWKAYPIEYIYCTVVKRYPVMTFKWINVMHICVEWIVFFTLVSVCCQSMRYRGHSVTGTYYYR